MGTNFAQLFALLSLTDNFSGPIAAAAAASEAATMMIASGMGRVQQAAAAAQAQFNNFSGDRIASQAQAVADAYDRVGGASKLTEDEQARVNAVMQDFIDKSEALGVAVPPRFQAIADATAHADEVTNVFDETLGRLAASFAIGTLIADATMGILDFAKGIPDAAFQLTNLSDKTGISITYLDQIKPIADASGSSLEEYAQAIYRGGVNIQEANTKTMQGLADLVKATGDQSLAWANLKADSPELQFKDVIAALSGMADKQLANTIGTEIYGRQYQTMAAAVNSGAMAMAASADVAGEAQVRAAAAGEAALIKIKDAAEDQALSVAGTFAIVLQSSDNVAKSEFWGALLKGDYAAAMQSLGVNAAALSVALKPLHDINLGIGTSGADFVAELKAARTAFAGLSQGTLAQIDAALKLQTSTKDLTSTFHLVPGELELIKKALADQTSETNKAAAANTAYWDRIDAAVAKESGVLAAQQMDDLTNKVFQMGGAANLSTTAMNDFYPAVDKLAASGVALSPILQDVKDRGDAAAQQTAIYTAIVNDAAGAMWAAIAATIRFNAELDTMDKTLDKLASKPLASMFPDMKAGAEALVAYDKALLKANTDTENWGKDLSLVGGAFRDLSSLTTGTMSTIAADIGKGVSALDSMTKGLAAMGKASTTTFDSKTGLFSTSTDWGQMAAGMISVAGAIFSIGSAVGSFLNSILSHGINDALDAIDKLGSSPVWTDAANPDSVFGANNALKDYNNQLAQLQGTATLTKPVLDNLLAGITAGGPNATTAMTTLNGLVTTFTAQAATTGGVWSAQFHMLIDQSAQLGLNVSGITAALQTQRTNATTGLSTALGVTSAAYTASDADQLAIAKNQQILSDPTSTTSAMQAAQVAIQNANADLATQQGILQATGIKTQQQAGAVAASIMAIVDANRKAGMSFTDALKAAEPAIQGLQVQLDRTGLSGGASFDFLNAEVKLVTGAITGPALTAVEGYTAGVVGLANAGLLTQDTFSGLESQIGTTYSTLIAQGATGQQAIAALQPDLQAAWQLEQQFGYHADAATQALIDQGVASGVVGEKQKTATDQMIDALNQMVAVLTTVANKMVGPGGLVDSAVASAKGINSAYSTVTGPSFGGAGIAPVPVMDQPMSAVTRSGYAYVKAGVDVVGAPSMTPGYAGGSVGGGSSSSDKHLVGIRSDIAALPYVLTPILSRAVRDAVLLAS